MPTPNVDLADLDPTYGVVFVGVGLATILYGVSLSQLHWYLHLNPEDGMRLKLLAIGIVLLETAHQGFIMHGTYWYFVTNFTRPSALGISPPTLLIGGLLEGPVSVVVELFFLQRLWIMSKSNRMICFPIIAAIFAHLALSVLWPADALTNTHMSSFPRLNAISIAGAAAAAVVDFSIAFFMCVYLYRSRTGYNTKTDKVVTRLMLFAMNTGVLFMICSVLNLLFVALDNCWWGMLASFVRARVYPISFIASLNTRTELHRMIREEAHKVFAPTSSKQALWSKTASTTASTFDPSKMIAEKPPHSFSQIIDVQTGPKSYAWRESKDVHFAPLAPVRRTSTSDDDKFEMKLAPRALSPNRRETVDTNISHPYAYDLESGSRAM